MDLISIPACALCRNVGTIIVRLKMEVLHCNRRPSGLKPVHRPPSGCEQCKRTRLISKYNSDCDSVVDKCRLYRSSSARSRYVNVCAAVCLLLLVGGLSPRSSAALLRNRAMELKINSVCTKAIERDRAATGRTSKKCSHINRKAILHSYSSFDALLINWDEYEWLRKFIWYRPEILPKEKKLYSRMPDKYMKDLMKNIDDVLPVMYKGLKMIVAGMYAFSKEGLNDNIVSDETLKENINQTMNDVRAVLCYFSDILKARNLEVLPLLDSEIPDFNTDDKLSVGLLLYRDTLNYLEYLAQVFEELN
ncbi:Uncharacterized protein OBRU01_10353 [Operophtera brumata]|uniref:Uncharacterized protein n=1 Tax=Operophtera brumata TaxID=104452 RepID=A0A0L7LDW2_OPEBR|nr:Uncharacterized protein OBRU01_10353 [Operophtera brumata]